MSEAAGSWQCQFDHSFSIDGVTVQVVEQRAVLVVVRHQPQLGPCAIIWASRKTVAATLLKNGDLANTDINNTNKYAKNDKWDALFGTFVVSSYKTQDVFMAEHDCLIDFCFPEPGSLLPGWEDLHSYVTTPPTSTPHLSKTTFTDDFLEDNCSGHSSLDKQRQACSKKMITENSHHTTTTCKIKPFCCFILQVCTDQSLNQKWTGCIWGLAGIGLWLGRDGHRRGPPPPASACGYRPSGGIDTGTNPLPPAEKAGRVAQQSQQWTPPVPMSHQGRSLPQVLAEMSLQQEDNKELDL